MFLLRYLNISYSNKSDSVFVLKVSAMETQSRAEPVTQEDKTKLLKAAFLQFCR